MLLISLVIILLSCELFTNGIEWMGKKMKVGDGVVGSIFSAVGTCLPETMIPVIAILFTENSLKSDDVGIGAIVGAPFMLSTLAFFISGLSVLLFWNKRKTGMKMHVNKNILSRDIGFFIIVYTIGISAAFVGSQQIKFLIAMFLIVYYVYYIVLTVKQDSISYGNPDTLYIVLFVNTKPTAAAIVFQVLMSLLGIVFGAHIFVSNLQLTAETIGISTLVLSLIITPIATELPEKFNSILWISKKKDTLALGNITGAMVFQSCIPVAIGILGTSWVLDIKAVASAVLSLLSALVVYLWINIRGRLSPVPLIVCGLFYAAFIAFLTLRDFK